MSASYSRAEWILRIAVQERITETMTNTHLSP
jgi:hypothetical protein